MKTDPLWYAALCALVYIAVLPMFLIVLFVTTVAGLFGKHEWGYKQISRFTHHLP